MRVSLCTSTYAREPDGPRGPVEYMHCQYIASHPTERHSFFAVQTQDELDVVAQAQSCVAVGDDKTLLENIEGGSYDSLLEAILSAAHNRKRALRGVRGFPRMERRQR